MQFTYHAIPPFTVAFLCATICRVNLRMPSSSLAVAPRPLSPQPLSARVESPALDISHTWSERHGFKAHPCRSSCHSFLRLSNIPWHGSTPLHSFFKPWKPGKSFTPMARLHLDQPQCRALQTEWPSEPHHFTANGQPFSRWH